MANTESTRTLPNGENKTSTALSTNIIIRVNDRPVGAIQQLTVNEKRPVKMIDEVGTDGHIDSTPNGSTSISGNCQRIRFDRLRIAEAFSRGFVHVSSQIYPFDIQIIDKQKRSSANYITTVLKNVWLDGIDYTYSVSDWIITDSMSWQAEAIYSFMGTNLPVAQGGELGIKPNTSYLFSDGSTESVEQLVDRGNANRRGSLDTSGIIDIVNGNTGKLY